MCNSIRLSLIQTLACCQSTPLHWRYTYSVPTFMNGGYALKGVRMFFYTEFEIFEKTTWRGVIKFFCLSKAVTQLFK